MSQTNTKKKTKTNPSGRQTANNTHRLATFKSFNSSLVFFILNLRSDTTEYKPTSNRIIPIRKIKSKKPIIM